MFSFTVANASNNVLLGLILKHLYVSTSCSGESKTIFQDDDGTHPTQTACSALARNYESLEQLKYEKVVEIHNNSEKSKALQQAVENAVECIQMFMSAGYPLTAQDYSNGTILHSLCWAPYDAQLNLLRKIVIYMLTSLPDGEIQLRHLVGVLNDDGFSCLHFAVKSSKKSGDGSAPVNQYIQMRNDEVIDLLKPFASESSLGQCLDHPNASEAVSPVVGTSNGSKKARPYLLRRGPHNRISVSERWVMYLLLSIAIADIT
jgi:hypothetical protein